MNSRAIIARNYQCEWPDHLTVYQVGIKKGPWRLGCSSARTFEHLLQIMMQAEHSNPSRRTRGWLYRSTSNSKVLLWSIAARFLEPVCNSEFQRTNPERNIGFKINHIFLFICLEKKKGLIYFLEINQPLFSILNTDLKPWMLNRSYPSKIRHRALRKYHQQHHT